MRILVTDYVWDTIDIERSILEPLGAELVVAPATDEDTLAGLAREADAILVCFAKITERVVEAAAAGGCRIISRSGIGLDNIDIAAATAAGIRVTNVPDYCIEEVADHTLALLLTSARGILDANRGVAAGDWTVPHGRVHRLRGRTLALLGVGRIGHQVAIRAKAFGLDVVGFDPHLVTPIDGLAMAPTKEDAVAHADFVSLHAPLTEQTHHMVDDALVAAMRRAPVVINTSRGGLIDLDAALRGLDSGRLGGLAIDVTEIEPPAADSPLRHDPRVIVTPHMAFYSVESTAVLQRSAADEVARALQGLPARCPVN